MVLILSYENEISFTCKFNSFSYERMSTKTRFEEEAKGNSEMAYCLVLIPTDSAPQFLQKLTPLSMFNSPLVAWKIKCTGFALVQ